MPKSAKKPSKKALRKRLERQLALLPDEDRKQLEKLGKLKRKALRKQVRKTVGKKVAKLEVGGRRAKTSCCGKPLGKMCSRCPRRAVLDLAVA